MPEAAEVTVAAGQLAHIAVGRCLLALPVTHPRTMRGTTRRDLDRFLGRRVVGVDPVGKWILVGFDGVVPRLGIHLRMSGQLLAHHPSDVPGDRHVHAQLQLGTRSGPPAVVAGIPDAPPDAAGTGSESVTVWFRDPRTFGELRVLDSVPGMEDVRDPAITGAVLFQRASRRSVAAKAVMLDQARFVAGIGSYLADEILHAVGIDPRARASELAVSTWDCIIEEARLQIEASAQTGGVTLVDEGWVDLWERPGGYADVVRVHARDTCGTCGGPTSSGVMAGRSARWCRRCQHPGRRRVSNRD